MMELMTQQWDNIMLMPYQFFIDTLKWKIDLEDEKRKKMEEQARLRDKKYTRKPGIPNIRK